MNLLLLLEDFNVLMLTAGNTLPFPFPFNFRAVAVLVRFQTVSVLSQGQLIRSSECPDGVIKQAQSLIAQEGSQQFSDRDRARVRAT